MTAVVDAVVAVVVIVDVAAADMCWLAAACVNWAKPRRQPKICKIQWWTFLTRNESNLTFLDDFFGLPKGDLSGRVKFLTVVCF